MNIANDNYDQTMRGSRTVWPERVPSRLSTCLNGSDGILPRIQKIADAASIRDKRRALSEGRSFDIVNQETCRYFAPVGLH